MRFTCSAIVLFSQQGVRSLASKSSKVLRLIEPHKIEEVTIERSLLPHEVLIEPELVSICHADLRYYTGQRRQEALAKKLPMALFHEGIGTVLESNSEEIKNGQRVVIVPNLPAYEMHGTAKEECCEYCNGIGENYCEHGGFLASGIDGMAQSRLVISASNAIPIPDDVPDHIAVLTELCSVSHQALERVRDRLQSGTAVVFGDGPVGYMTAAMLHHMYKLNDDRLTVFGAIEEKLNNFDFAQRQMVQTYNFENGPLVDIAIECTGGKFSQSAINQAIQILKPGGVLILMGVTEDLVPINTRDVLEKGITMFGSSRSTAYDFKQIIQAMRQPAYQQSLNKIVPKHYENVSTADQLAKVMESAAAHRSWEKTIIQFNW